MEIGRNQFYSRILVQVLSSGIFTNLLGVKMTGSVKNRKRRRSCLVFVILLYFL